MSIFDIGFNDLSEAGRSVNPGAYKPSPELSMAVKVAIKLGQPLLLTGEPGTGKTQLAYAIAHDLHQDYPHFLPQPLVFHTKTTSVANDLFYTYDAIRHFHDANVKKASQEIAPPIHEYIKLQALGRAIALTNTQEVRNQRFVHSADLQPRASVVLIDEIDKAPRDFPNDILHEIENFEFEIKEAENYLIQKEAEHPIIIIMTSNSEKNLPDAFLRRCVFYHIPFPGEAQLLEIVRSHFASDSLYANKELIQHFLEIRDLMKKKKPATAELLAWLKILELERFLEDAWDTAEFNDLKVEKKHILKYSYSVLAKTSEDLESIKNMLQ